MLLLFFLILYDFYIYWHSIIYNSYIMRKIFTLLSIGMIFYISANATSPIKKDSIAVNKDSIPPIETRQANDNPISGGPNASFEPTRTATPNPASIYVNRDTEINSYTPEDLVRKILLNTHTSSDAQRIQNVEHSGWNWNQPTKTWIKNSRVPHNNVWGRAANPSQGGVVAQYEEDERSLAYFANGDNAGFELDYGLLMGTGPVLMAEGPNVTNHGMNDGMTNNKTTNATLQNRNAMHGEEEFGYSSTFNPTSLGPYSNGTFYRKHEPNKPWNPDQSFDRDLDALTSDDIIWTTCGSTLEFDFQPAISQATFDYVFASDEYPEGVYQANDVFGFFISGPYDTPPGSDIENTTAPFSIINPTTLTEHTRSGDDSVYYRYNIARLPDNNPVGIDYVNWGINNAMYTKTMTTNPYSVTNSTDYHYADPTTMSLADVLTYRYATGYDPTPNGIATDVNTRLGITSGRYYYVPTNPDLFKYNHVGQNMMEYDGYTVKLQAIADKLIPGKWYHLKLAVAQTVQKDGVTQYLLDNNHGSSVFLANLDLGKLESNLKNPYLITDLDQFGQDANGNSYLYDDCDQYVLTFKFDTIAAKNQSVVQLSYENIDPDYLTGTIADTIKDRNGNIILKYNKLFPDDTLHLAGKDDTLRHYQFRISTDYPAFENGEYIKIITSVIGGNSDTLKHQLFNRVGWDVQYTPATIISYGSLKLNLVGGSNRIFYSLDNGDTWNFARDTASGKELPFSNWELLSLNENFDILLKEPASCWMDTIHMYTGGGNVTIQRYIDIPNVTGMSTTPTAGKHYAEGHQDFSFYATFTGSPLNLKAKGYYSGTILDLDSKAELQDDGSYKYTIRQVTEPWTIFVDYTSNNGVHNQNITDLSVWTNGKSLLINSPASCVANIYTLTGILYKQEEVNGNKTIQLPSGVYIVVINNNQYKILIR